MANLRGSGALLRPAQAAANAAEPEGPLEVLLNVYDVAGGGKEAANSKVVLLNNLTRDLQLGGIFHGGLQIGTAEFSFGFCERGTGVYAVQPTANPMYVYRETLSLGSTDKSMAEVRDVLAVLRKEWPGASYDLLHRNCCHFCTELAERLGVEPVPAWLNRFAASAAATVDMTQETVKKVQELGVELGRLSGESLGLLANGLTKTIAVAASGSGAIADKLAGSLVLNPSSNAAGDGGGADGAEQQQQPAGGLMAAPLRGATAAATTAATTAAAAGASLLSGVASAGATLRLGAGRLVGSTTATLGRTVGAAGGLVPAAQPKPAGDACLQPGSDRFAAMLEEPGSADDDGARGGSSSSLTALAATGAASS